MPRDHWLTGPSSALGFLGTSGATPESEKSRGADVAEELVRLSFLLTAREPIEVSALLVGFFGVLFRLRFDTSSVVVGTTLIASTVLSAATLAAATYFTAGIGAP
jgi:hypothetical protein